MKSIDIPGASRVTKFQQKPTPAFSFSKKVRS